MVFDPTSAPHLKPWLVRTLEPICDAEPGALADYILALLRHNVPESEMRTELAVQLDEFLEKECSSFIETLFTVLRTKSYLPYGAAPASPSFSEKPLLDTGIPIPLDGLLTPTTPQERTRKRSNTNDERDGRPPAKGPRLNTEGQFSRYGNGGADGRMGQLSTGGWGRLQGDRFRDGGLGPYNNGQMSVVMGMGMNGMGQMNSRRPQTYQPPDQKRGICRDYHNNGYCARGAMCKYSHGDDAVIPSQVYPMNGGPSGSGMPFIPLFPGNPNGMPFMQGAAYDPHEARMDMRPMTGRNHQRAPLLPRIQQEDGRVIHPINASGELPVIQDLTPTIYPDVPDLPSADPAPSSDDVDMPQANNQAAPNQMANNFNPIAGPMNGYPVAVPSMDVDMAGPSGMRPPLMNHGQFRGGGRGHGGRGRGTFGGEVHNFRPEKRNDKTLVVEKIPEDKLSLEKVNAWFKRFGTVTNVAIDAVNAKALVSFSNHDEAHVAWKSEDAVFGNRFVKVFWHRPMEGHGQVGTRMLAASAPLVANMATAAQTLPTSQPSASNVPSVPPTTSTSTSTSAITSTTNSTPRKATTAPPPPALSALAAKQHRLEETINEQKTLMASLETASADQKKDIMAKLRKLGEEMTNLTVAASSTPETTSGTGGGTVPPNSGKKSGFDKMTEHERKEKERLDQELDMNHQHEDKTEDLKAKLERLKAEAASLGLDAPLPSSSSGYRGHRGRGRGASRSYFRGGPVIRGRPPRGSMKLDNRPKKLLVKGVHEDGSQALRDWYETTGQLESVESAEAGAYLISFKSRAAAEQGLAKGTNIPIVGAVQISWYTSGNITANGSTTSTPILTAVTKLSPTMKPSGRMTGVVESSNKSNSRGKIGSERPQTPDIHHSHIQEEEIIASGWGVDEDDGDGMGML
ncbi:hypothetical protein BYT27DRAFT_7137640 [Phlegmacium glaucopus]|nr:hypothetical protein BYT27DRAFT_7137640 [Phlegmacium glaucopus]